MKSLSIICHYLKQAIADSRLRPLRRKKIEPRPEATRTKNLVNIACVLCSSINQSINQSFICIVNEYVKSKVTEQQGKKCAYSCHIKIQEILKYYYKKLTKIK